MISSMTGYGKCEKERQLRKVNIEISTVNHRYGDVSIRMPRMFVQLEEHLRKIVKEKLARGKVEVSIYYTSEREEDIQAVVNEQICKAYITSLRALGKTYDLQDNIGLAEVMKLNDVITIQKQTTDLEEVTGLIQEALREAVDEVAMMRAVEGEALRLDLLNKNTIINEIVSHIEALSEGVVDNYRIRLENRLAKLLDNVPVDENRLATEIAIIADKSAIDEEITRLKSHINQLELIMTEGGCVGRKLDFLMQEMNREANTIAAKSSGSEMTNHVVSLKTEIEKMREQIQNIE